MPVSYLMDRFKEIRADIKEESKLKYARVCISSLSKEAK